MTQHLTIHFLLWAFCHHQITTPSPIGLVGLSNKMLNFLINFGQRAKWSFGQSKSLAFQTKSQRFDFLRSCLSWIMSTS